MRSGTRFALRRTGNPLAMVPIVHRPADLDFDRPGKYHYRLAFHMDSGWGSSLVPITVINGLRPSGPGTEPAGLAAFGGTHGNEWEGQIAVKRLCEELDPAEISGRVILMPQLNQSACAANQRTSPLDEVNMNRAFPGNPRGTITFRIAHFVKTCVFPRVRVVIDLHAGGREGGFALCTSIHPVPDPGQFAEMIRLASLFDAPFILVYSSEMASGLLTDEAEADGKVALGGEFGFGENVSRRGVQHACEGIRNVLKHYRMLNGSIISINPSRPFASRLVDARNLEDYVPCPQEGIWEPLVDLGDEVSEGEPVGLLHSFSDHSCPPLKIHARRSGFILMMCGAARCAEGSTLYVIAREIPAPMEG